MSSESEAKALASGPLALWSGLPLALVRGALGLLRPSRLLALLAVLVLAAAPPTAAALLGWDAAVAWVQGDLLRSAPFAWWMEQADGAGLGGVRSFLGPALIALLWLPAVLGLLAWMNSVLLARWLWQVPPSRGAVARALRGLLSVLVFWALWLLALPLAILPFLGWIVPVLLWAWLLVRLVLADARAAFAVPRSRLLGPVMAAVFALAVISIVPPLAVLVPMWLWLAVGQLARGWRGAHDEEEKDELG